MNFIKRLSRKKHRNMFEALKIIHTIIEKIENNSRELSISLNVDSSGHSASFYIPTADSYDDISFNCDDWGTTQGLAEVINRATEYCFIYLIPSDGREFIERNKHYKSIFISAIQALWLYTFDYYGGRNKKADETIGDLAVKKICKIKNPISNYILICLLDTKPVEYRSYAFDNYNDNLFDFNLRRKLAQVELKRRGISTKDLRKLKTEYIREELEKYEPK